MGQEGFKACVDFREKQTIPVYKSSFLLYPFEKGWGLIIK
jgi:hypothetical protein